MTPYSVLVCFSTHGCWLTSSIGGNSDNDDGDRSTVVLSGTRFSAASETMGATEWGTVFIKCSTRRGVCHTTSRGSTDRVLCTMLCKSSTPSRLWCGTAHYAQYVYSRYDKSDFCSLYMNYITFKGIRDVRNTIFGNVLKFRHIWG